MSATRARSVSVGIGMALALLTATVSTVPLASAAVPAPSALTHTSPDSTTTVLSWDRELSAARYTVQVDNDSGFGSPEFSQVSSNTTAVPHTALKPGLNHWRVQATSPSGAKSDWTTASFERPDPLVPQLVSPTDGAELAQPTDSPLLQWSEVPGAKSYAVEIDDAADFIGSKKFTTSTTSIVPSSPLPLGSWFWRVSATDASGQVSKPAEPNSFRIRALPAPELISPADSADEELEDVVLDWAPVPGAASYQVQATVNDSFEAGELITNLSGIRSTRYSPTGGYDNDQYQWRVRAIDAAGSPSAWSQAPYEFGRAWADRPWPVTPVQPGFPSYPADFDTTDPKHKQHPFYPTYVKNHDPDALPISETDEPSPFLQWTPVQHASHYQVQLSSTPTFVPTNTVTCTVAGTTFTPTNAGFPSARLDHKCPVKEGSRYYWRVRAIDNPYPVEGIYSPIQKFVWQPVWFSNVTPSHGAEMDTPTFSWKSRVAANEFRIEVRNSRGSRVASGSTRANSWTSPNELKPSDGPFEWTLTAITADGTSSLIRGREFTLSDASSPAPTDLPPLTATSGTASDSPSMRAPKLSWTPHPEAAFYRVDFGYADVASWLVPSSNESFGENLRYPTLTDTGTRIMNPGSYKWRVQAYSATGERIDTSETNIVRIAGFEEVVGQRIGLDGAALAAGGGCDLPLDRVNNSSTCPEVPTTPVLAWQPQDGIAFYGVYVSNDQNFTNLTEKNIPASTGTMYAYDMLTLPDNTSGVPYYWHIRPCKAVGICAPDPVSSATGLAKHAFKKVSPLVETVATPEVVSTDEVSFEWRDYHDTNQNHSVTRDGAPSWSAVYHRNPGASGPINPSDLSNQSAAQYRIRVATDSTFNNVIDTQTVEQTTYTSTGKLYPQGPLYWKVAALDVNGNELSSSPARRFTKSGKPAKSLSPVSGARVPGTVSFRWEAQPFTSQYEIEISRNDPQFSTANRLFTTKVWTTAYTWTKPIPVSNESYHWRVRRIDASGNLTAWSTGVPFRVVSESVSLTSPAAGSIQVPNGPSLVWKPVTGAATYLVELKDPSGKVVESRTTPATAYAPFVTLASGRHTWSVTARDNNAKALAAPSLSHFVVDSELSAQSRPRIAINTEAARVGTTLTGSAPTWNRAGVTSSYQWMRGTSTIRGATEKTYVTTVSDFGKEISVRVTGSLPSYVSQVVDSAPVAIGTGPAVKALTPPAISGKAAVGQRLTVSAPVWPIRMTTKYQWLRQGRPIPGATARSYTLGIKDSASSVSVRAVGTATGVAESQSLSPTVKVPKASSTIAAQLSKKSIQRGQKVTVTATLKVATIKSPTGTVQVKRGKKTIKSVKVRTKHKGRITIKLPKSLKRGKHVLRLYFKGTTKINKSKSKKVVLRVK